MRTLPLLAALSACGPAPDPPARAGRPFVQTPAGFAAPVPLAGAEVRFDERGAVAVAHGRETLRIQTRAIGRPGQARRPDAASPHLRPCSEARTCTPRLEWDRGEGVTEWWVARVGGVQQGWTLAEPPPGPGPLFIDVDAGGPVAVHPDGGSAMVRDTRGAPWHIGALAAWDADGRVLSIHLDGAASWLRIRVDDTGARYPLTVDPLYATATTTLLGDEHQFGTAVSGGDFDGDGMDELAVGAPSAGYQQGAVHVYAGSAAGTAAAAGTVIVGAGPDAYLGQAVDGRGDLDGDGYDDLVIGSWGEDTVQVHYGSATGLSRAPDTTISAPAATDERFGWSLTSASDVDGDGYDDLVIGAFFSENTAGLTAAGRIYVLMGGAAGVGTTPTLLSEGSTAGEYHGYALDGGADVDGDGTEDVVMGDYGGGAHVLLGSGAGLSATPASTTTGTGTGYARAVGFAGDVDGDGHADIIVGDPSLSGNAGAAYLHLGHATGVSTTPATTITGTTGGDRVGCAVGTAGDIDGDGHDDVLVGAYGLSSFDGGVQLHLGTATGASATAATTITGPADGGLGVALVGGLDTDGDGAPDLGLGAPLEGDRAGSALVVEADGSGGVATRTTLAGPRASSYFGQAVGLVGDLDGDGHADAAVGAWGADGNAGRVFVYQGGTDGLDAHPWMTADGAAGSRLGYALAGAGDVDGDGYDDLLVGAYKDEEAFLWSGGAGGPTSAAATTLAPSGGGSTRDFGRAVGAAGDLDGDGHDDVVVGAFSDDNAWVFLGAASGLSPTEDVHLQGTSGDDFGTAVVGAGDIDGDGYDDLAVGAPSASSRTGAAAVFLGGAGGIAGTADQTLQCPTASCDFGADLAGTDVDADGFADLLVGASAARSGHGGAWLYYGSSTGLEAAAPDALQGHGTGSQFGERVATGDLNGDGFGDLVVADDTGSGNAGRVYVFLGGLSGVGPTADLSLTGATVGSRLGLDVSSGQDVNADGHDDLLVGALSAAHLYRGYQDDDGDGVLAAVDCDDDDASVGVAATTGWPDDDGDGYGQPGAAQIVCSLGSGYAGVDTDCDDTDASVHPGAVEGVADGVDADCDGVEDCYVDADGDGYRPDATSTVVSADLDCVDAGEAEGVDPTGDCDDADAAVNPAATEGVADGLDADCDGTELCYVDDDDDGYRPDATSTVVSADLDCVDAGEAEGGDPTGDCDDADAAVNPAAAEGVADGVDADCDGTERCYVDDDGDGYRPDATSTVASADLDCADAGEAEGTDPTGDCDDADAAVNPAAAEGVADGLDADCDGTELCYADTDDDGHRPDATTTTPSTDLDCTDPSEAESSDPTGDCDDTDPMVHPAATELIADAVDQDCDGTELCYADTDDDGWRPDESTTTASADLDCADATEAGAADPIGDCDDADPTVNPGAVDTPDDGIDQDCDGADAETPADTGSVAGDTGGAPADDTGGDPGGGADTPDDGGKPGCATVSAAPAPLVLALALLGLARRRQPPPPVSARPGPT